MKINENTILQYLVKKQDFFVEEYECSTLGTKKWIALRNIEGGVYAVIVSNEKEEKISSEYAGYHLRGRGEGFVLVNVVLTDGHYEGTDEELFYSRVIYDLNSQRVIKYESNGEYIYNCINEMQDKSSRKINISGNSKITFILITINVIVFLMTALLSGSITYIKGNVLVYFGAKYNPLIDIGQYYRLVTAMFLHSGIMHIAFNMYALYSLGNLIDKIYGKWRYLLIYFGAGILSTTTSYLFSNSMSVGASGAIFGLFGAAAVFGIKERDRIGQGFIREIGTVILLNVIIGFSTQYIDNFAHFGGLIGGAIIALLVYKRKTA